MASSTALLEVHGTSYQLDEDGRLQHNEVWTEDIAVALAKNIGITLTKSHWKIINLLREFYEEFNHAPIMKLFLKETASKLGKEFTDQAFLSELFPGCVLTQSTIIAGIPSPHKASLIQDTKSIASAHNSTLKHQMNDFYQQFEFNGEIYHLTNAGNLVEHYFWSEQMAEYFAQKEGIELTEDHWLVIRFIRAFYDEYLISPMVKLLIKHMKASIGEEKSNQKYLYELFPEGPAKQGARIAGLPDPVGCID